MYNIRKVHGLLLDQPATTEKKHAEMLKDFFFVLETVDGPQVPSFITGVFSDILYSGIPGSHATCSPMLPELPSNLIRSVIKAMAYAFGSENGIYLVKSYKYIIGVDKVSLNHRTKKNDLAVLTTLFEMLCPSDGEPQPLGMSASEYDHEITALLVFAFENRSFQKILVHQSDCSELSSVLKKYFVFAHKKTDRWSNITETMKAIDKLVGVAEVFWNSSEVDCLEYALASEFSFKTFSRYSPERRISIAAKLLE